MGEPKPKFNLEQIFVQHVSMLAQNFGRDKILPVMRWFEENYTSKPVKAVKPAMPEETPFKNAAKAAYKNGNLFYVEGWIVNDGVKKHAWNEVKTNGRQWVDYSTKATKGRKYFGVAIPTKTVLAVVRHPLWKESEGVLDVLNKMKGDELEAFLAKIQIKKGDNKLYHPYVFCRAEAHYKNTEVCRAKCDMRRNCDKYVDYLTAPLTVPLPEPEPRPVDSD